MCKQTLVLDAHPAIVIAPSPVASWASGPGRCGSSLAGGRLTEIPSIQDYVGPLYGAGLRLVPSFVQPLPSIVNGRHG